MRLAISHTLSFGLLQAVHDVLSSLDISLHEEDLLLTTSSSFSKLSSNGPFAVLLDTNHVPPCSCYCCLSSKGDNDENKEEYHSYPIEPGWLVLSRSHIVSFDI